MQTLEVAKVLLVNEKGEVLLLRRSSTDVRRPGQWDLPGGHVDEDEDIKQAVVRESREEAGVDIALRQLQLFYATSKAVADKHLAITWTFFMAQLDQTPSITLSEEHDEHQWLVPAQALQAITYDIQHTMLAYAVSNKLLVRAA